MPELAKYDVQCIIMPHTMSHNALPGGSDANTEGVTVKLRPPSAPPPALLPPCTPVPLVLPAPPLVLLPWRTPVGVLGAEGVGVDPELEVPRRVVPLLPPPPRPPWEEVGGSSWDPALNPNTTCAREGHGVERRAIVTGAVKCPVRHCDTVAHDPLPFDTCSLTVPRC
jgi:hypothetical protein